MKQHLNQKEETIRSKQKPTGSRNTDEWRDSMNICSWPDVNMVDNMTAMLIDPVGRKPRLTSSERPTWTISVSRVMRFQLSRGTRSITAAAGEIMMEILVLILAVRLQSGKWWLWWPETEGESW
jgi:hypothetical protein